MLDTYLGMKQMLLPASYLYLNKLYYNLHMLNRLLLFFSSLSNCGASWFGCFSGLHLSWWTKYSIHGYEIHFSGIWQRTWARKSDDGDPCPDRTINLSNDTYRPLTRGQPTSTPFGGNLSFRLRLRSLFLWCPVDSLWCAQVGSCLSLFNLTEDFDFLNLKIDELQQNPQWTTHFSSLSKVQTNCIYLEM